MYLDEVQGSEKVLGFGHWNEIDPLFCHAIPSVTYFDNGYDIMIHTYHINILAAVTLEHYVFANFIYT